MKPAIAILLIQISGGTKEDISYRIGKRLPPRPQPAVNENDSGSEDAVEMANESDQVAGQNQPADIEIKKLSEKYSSENTIPQLREMLIVRQLSSSK